MRNDKKTKIETIFSAAKLLPYFNLDDLASLEKNKVYLKILLSRYVKSGKAIRLKKGVYVARDYIDRLEKSGGISAYSEFLAGVLYSPSYLSLDYILYKHNILTEVPINFTAVTKKKTASFSNSLGNFFYHKIKDELFSEGYEAKKEGDFVIFRASKAKALFDWLYLRKNSIMNKEAAKELRLNLFSLSAKEKKELMKYINIEGSKKMKEIYHYLWSR